MNRYIKKSNSLKAENLDNTQLTKFWVNADNANFYTNIPINFFIDVAYQGGLDNGCDVLAISQYIKNAKSILEVGAGYGRVIENILKQGYLGRLTAIERNKTLCQYLQNNFEKNVEIICGDILKILFLNKYDLILWMWTGICEFSQPEQLVMINLLSNNLNTNGVLVIDTIPLECSTQNSLDSDEHNRIITTSYGNNYCYIPDPSEIAEYAKHCKLKHREKIIYRTRTDKTNYLYILEKIH